MPAVHYLHSRSPINGVSDSTFLIILIAAITPVIIAIIYALYRARWSLCNRLGYKSTKEEAIYAKVVRPYPFSLKRNSSQAEVLRSKTKRELYSSEPPSLSEKKIVFAVSKPAATTVHPLHPNHCNVAALIRTVSPPKPQSPRVIPPKLTRAQIGDILVGAYPGPTPASSAIAPMLEPIYAFKVGLAHSIRQDAPRKVKTVGKSRNEERRPLMVTHANGSLTWEMPVNKKPVERCPTKVMGGGKENA
ncbi:hypothetical protein BDZ89DRAFT_1060973 [Hymenopellis radicata]|nr:hypothetical protein BDZ89DRAFT_1060973 [Hymenopellis radicata]